MSAENQFTNEDGTPATWLEEIPAQRRKVAFLWRSGIGLAVSSVLIALLIWHDTPLLDGIYGVAWALGLGLLFGYLAYRRKEIRRYSVQLTQYTHRQRLRRAAVWWAWGCAIVALIWWFQISEGNFAERWWYPWPVLTLFLVGAGLYRLKSEATLTPAAAKAKSYFDKPQQTYGQPAEPARWEKELDKLITHVNNSPMLRYLLAAFCVGGAVYFGSLEHRNAWILVAASILFAVVLARELILWAVGAAIVCSIAWAIIAGLSALPLSAAIIIGALIIANSGK